MIRDKTNLMTRKHSHLAKDCRPVDNRRQLAVSVEVSEWRHDGLDDLPVAQRRGAERRPGFRQPGDTRQVKRQEDTQESVEVSELQEVLRVRRLYRIVTVVETRIMRMRDRDRDRDEK